MKSRWTEASYPRMQAANVSVDWRTWQVRRDSFLRVAWLIRTRDMTYSYVWYDSSLCVTWTIFMCDMIHSYVWCKSFTWLIHTCDLSHSYVQHESFNCVTRHIHMRTWQVWHNSFIHDAFITHSRVWHDSFTRVTRVYSHVRHVTINADVADMAHMCILSPLPRPRWWWHVAHVNTLMSHMWMAGVIRCTCVPCHAHVHLSEMSVFTHICILVTCAS